MAKQQHLRSHTAATRHTCSACGESIEPGQRYIRIADYQGKGLTVTKIHAAPCSSGAGRRSRRPHLPKQGWERD